MFNDRHDIAANVSWISRISWCCLFSILFLHSVSCNAATVGTIAPSWDTLLTLLFVLHLAYRCVTCQFIFELICSQAVNVLFEIALLFRITVKKTTLPSCVMIVMITFWTKYLTPFFSCHFKAIPPYFLQTYSGTLSKILLLFISQWELINHFSSSKEAWVVII